MTNTENDTAEALCCEERELALREGFASYRHQDLRHRQRALPETGPETTGKHNTLHG